MESKEKLVMALTEERERFVKLGHDVFDHNLAINYLQTGSKPKDYESIQYDYPILQGCVDDFETMLFDYDCI